MSIRDLAQELVELGPRGTLFRVAWELRTGLQRRARSVPSRAREAVDVMAKRVRFEDPAAVREAMHDRIDAGAVSSLVRTADEARRGRIVCFGKWTAEFGDPIDWHRHPVTGARYDAAAPWARALASRGKGDIKIPWEVARFPHAYHFARAAAFAPDRADSYAAALLEHIAGFADANPPGLGIHWASGQEIAVRLLAWVFAANTLLRHTPSGAAAEPLLAASLVAGARHIESHLDYSRIAVYNNHLLSEALALYATGVLLPSAADAPRWRATGQRLLDEQADRQFYADGGYIQQSHTYHRVAMQYYLWACALTRSNGARPSASWLRALDRSIDFLTAHQNPDDGRLPNYGANDGALPSPLSTCDFADMRPLLQAATVVVRGERLYEPGPWDEETAWLAGVGALDAPMRPPVRRSVSFAATGAHVLRGERSFAAFRCGTLRDRFSQIDMLHVDVWWRGLNVLVDGGSFRYNDGAEWHNHFMRTSSHNTVAIDGHDQMLHYRQFKVLYWTHATLLNFADRGDHAVCVGEHYGYRRRRGRCVHQRAVLFVKDDLWVVADRLTGSGEHTARLHWLGGPFPWSDDAGRGRLVLHTPAGPFVVQALDDRGCALTASAAAGQAQPPRGWLSRYYGDKTAAPSFAVETRGTFPLTLVTVFAGGEPRVAVTEDHRWTIAVGGRRAAFTLADGRFGDLAIDTCTS